MKRHIVVIGLLVSITATSTRIQAQTFIEPQTEPKIKSEPISQPTDFPANTHCLCDRKKKKTPEEREANIAIFNAIESQNDEKAMALILDHREKINDPDWAYVDYTCYWGNVTVLKFLIKNGADVNLVDCCGVTPLMTASDLGDPQIGRKKTAAEQENKVKCILILLMNGAKVKAADEKGWTALHYAAMSGNDPAVKMLVGNGADVKARTNAGKTPASIAVEWGNKATAKILLEE